jgi:hypothetical protein
MMIKLLSVFLLAVPVWSQLQQSSLNKLLSEKRLTIVDVNPVDDTDVDVVEAYHSV